MNPDCATVHVVKFSTIANCCPQLARTRPTATPAPAGPRPQPPRRRHHRPPQTLLFSSLHLLPKPPPTPPRARSLSPAISPNFPTGANGPGISFIPPSNHALPDVSALCPLEHV